MNTHIKNICKELNLNFVGCERVSRYRKELQPCYIVYTENAKYFLKFNRKPTSYFHKIIRLTLGNPGFERQIRINDLLKNNKFNYFHYPELAHTDGKTYLLLQYIDNMNIELNGRHKEYLVKSLGELQYSGLRLNKINKSIGVVLLSIMVRIEFRLIYSIPSLLKHTGLRSTIKYLKIIIISYVKERKLNTPIVLHSDFHRENVMVNKEEIVYITDYEGMRNERRWRYIDIATYAVDTTKYYIDTDIIKKYIRETKKRHENKYTDNALQLRIALLNRISRFMYFKPATDLVRDEYKKFYLNILLDDQKYDKWYIDNIIN